MSFIKKTSPQIRTALKSILTLFIFLYAASLTFSMAGMELSAFGITVCFLLYVLFDYLAPKRTLEWHTIGAEFPIIGFLIVAAVGLFVKAPDQFSSFGSLRNILFLFILTYSLQVFKNLNKLIWLIWTLALIVAVYAIWQHFTGMDLWREKGINMMANSFGGQNLYQSIGFFSHHLTYSHSFMMIACFPIAAFLLSAKSKWWQRGIYFLSSAILLFSIVTTYARGSWLALAVAIPVMTLFVSKKKLIIVTLVFAAAIGIAFKVNPNIKSRAMSIIDITNVDNSARRALWSANMTMFNENPWLGVGYKQNEGLTQKYFEQLGITSDFYGHAHSNYLELLATTGILGFAFYMLLILAFILMTARLYTSIPKTHFWHKVFTLAILGAQIAFHVGGLTQWNFGDGEVQHQFFFWLAVMSYMSHRYYAHIVPDDRSL
ncbi:MAG: O-antigen ligase family protein [Oligoflexia bacterium]|nr:O-antigen ligase family protein [Oligoflexia bacterium]